MEKILEIVKIKQVLKESEYQLQFNKINSPYDCEKIFSEVATNIIGDDDREIFLVMCLNTKHEINAIHRCSIGALSSAIVSPREVFKACILNNSSAFIVAHNHPSLSLEISNEDIAVTKRLQEAGELLGIELLDHLIVNMNGDFISLRDRGHMKIRRK
uniref:Putative DNA repair protein RadC n=1 Tax=Aeromonas sp. Ne-1 TaxID=1675689 RepID=A0A0H4JMX7_9GAMM|nr:JAB domain-containing protein [Aeromonas sp. Ne-1]AKO69676.1 putative DNA repair protein RadC [Aeromonas sp. Ne-1]